MNVSDPRWAPKWNGLDILARRRLLRLAYPDRNETLIIFEARKQWAELMPSTQIALTYVDWRKI